MFHIVKKTIEANAITHGGLFHADETMATAILNKVFNNLILCRTFKVPEEVAAPVIVYDIGGGKYDHHQKGGNGCRENGVPYSSAGLIWRDFGRLIPEVSESANPDLVWSLIARTKD